MMLTQSRGGHIFNIDGAGSDGRPTPRFPRFIKTFLGTCFSKSFLLSVMSNSIFLINV